MKNQESKMKTATNRTPEDESALKELFVDSLKDLYWAEKHLTKAHGESLRNKYKALCFCSISVGYNIHFL